MCLLTSKCLHAFLEIFNFMDLRNVWFDLPIVCSSIGMRKTGLCAHGRITPVSAHKNRNKNLKVVHIKG